MKTKLVSIIVPVYNVENYIKETLDSITEQTYKNLEIIIVNDGSRDSSLSILKEYAQKDKRIHVVNQNNKGLSGARNSGLEVALGDYICIFDADDIMFPNKIEEQVEYLEQNLEIDFVYSNLIHFIDETKKERELQVKKIFLSPYKELLEGNFINPNTILMRKEVVKKSGIFDESLRSSEDWDYFLTIARNNFKFAYIDQYLTKYRVRNTSLSADGRTMYETALVVLNKQKEYCSKNNFSEFLLIIDTQINNRKRLLKLLYLIHKDYIKYNNIQVSLSNTWKIILIIVKIFPKNLSKILYNLVRRIKFYRNSKKIT